MNTAKPTATASRLRIYEPASEPRPEDQEYTLVGIPTTFGRVSLRTRAWSMEQWEAMPREARPLDAVHFPGVGVVEYTV